MTSKTKAVKSKVGKSVKKGTNKVSKSKQEPSVASRLFKDAFIKDFTLLQKTVEAHQKAGKKVVLTQGVYVDSRRTCCIS